MIELFQTLYPNCILPKIYYRVHEKGKKGWQARGDEYRQSQQMVLIIFLYLIQRRNEHKLMQNLRVIS
jgi:hypothetical protein